MRSRLAALLDPITPEEFLSTYVFKRPLLVRGEPAKFASLFGWSALNRILSYSRHDPKRVHLDQVGVPEGTLPYTHHVRNVRGESIPRLDVPALYQHLRRGATLVVDALNEVDPQIAAVSEELAARLSTSRATTVLFASFGRTSGFAAHWDSRDVYAVQVEGEKYWRVYEPSRDAPLGRGDASVPGSGEPGAPWWEGTLQRGDLLYLPRGWWHEATSTDSPSLHVNFGFAPVTGVELAEWLVDQLAGDAFMRKDVPRFDGPAALEAYTRALVARITERLGPSCVDTFLESRRATAPPQTHVSLPFGVDPQSTLDPDQRVRLVSPLFALVDDAGAATLRGAGRERPVPDWMAPVTRHLRATESATVAELANLVGDAASLTDVCRVLEALIEGGFVCTAP